MNIEETNLKPSIKSSKMGKKVSDQFKKQNIKNLKVTEENMKTTNNINENDTLNISDKIKKLSDGGLVSILMSHDHVTLFGDETRDELEQILQLNINDDLIDEIEIITVLNGEINDEDLNETTTSASSGQYSSKFFVDPKNGKNKKPLYKGGVIIEPNPNTHDMGVHSFKVVSGKLNEGELKEILVKNIDKLGGEGKKFKIKTKDGRVAVVRYLGKSEKNELNPDSKHTFVSTKPDPKGWDEVFNYNDNDIRKKVHLFTTKDSEVNESNVNANEKLPYNNMDKVILDIPLLIRLMEFAKEDAKTDMQLHKVAENLVLISKNEKILTMNDYERAIEGINDLDETTTAASSGSYSGKLRGKQKNIKPTYNGGQIVSKLKHNTLLENEDDDLIGKNILYYTHANSEPKKTTILKIEDSKKDIRRRYIKLADETTLVISTEDLFELRDKGKAISVYISPNNFVYMQLIDGLELSESTKKIVSDLAKEFDISEERITKLVNERLNYSNFSVEDPFVKSGEEGNNISATTPVEYSEEVPEDENSSDNTLNNDQNDDKTFGGATKPVGFKYQDINEFKQYVTDISKKVKRIVENNIDKEFVEEEITDSYFKNSFEIEKLINESFNKKIKSLYIAKKIVENFIYVENQKD